MESPVKAPPVKARSQRGEVDQGGTTSTEPHAQEPPVQLPRAELPRAVVTDSESVHSDGSDWGASSTFSLSVLEQWELDEEVDMEPDGYAPLDRRGWLTEVTGDGDLMARLGFFHGLDDLRTVYRNRAYGLPTGYAPDYRNTFFFWDVVRAMECQGRWRRRGFQAEVIRHGPVWGAG